MSDVLQGPVLLDDSVDLELQEHLVNPTRVMRLTRAEGAQPIRDGISLDGVADDPVARAQVLFNEVRAREAVPESAMERARSGNARSTTWTVMLILMFAFLMGMAFGERLQPRCVYHQQVILHPYLDDRLVQLLSSAPPNGTSTGALEICQNQRWLNDIWGIASFNGLDQSVGCLEMAEMIMTRGVISIDDLMKNYLRKQANLAKISKTLVVMAIVAAAHYLYQAQFD